MTRPNIISFLLMVIFQNVPEAYSRQGHSKRTIKHGSRENLSPRALIIGKIQVTSI